MTRCRRHSSGAQADAFSPQATPRDIATSRLRLNRRLGFGKLWVRRETIVTYEYRCKDCGKLFEVIATIAEKDAGLEPECSECGSTRAAQVFGAIEILSSTGSGGDFEPGAACGPSCECHGV